MNNIIINQIREYKVNSTIGEIYINGEFFCYSLEDVGRPANTKVYGETCIPEGVYKLKVNLSNRFKREMVLLYNQKDYSVDYNGVRFTGIRVHGGNDVGDTEGCPLVAFNKINDEMVYSKADIALVDKLKGFDLRNAKWIISSI